MSINKNVSTSKIVSKELKKLFNISTQLPDDLITNDDIRKRFVTLMTISHIIPSGSLKLIWNLVNNQIIIPVNVKKKGLLSWLNKMLQKSIVPFSYYDGVLAFYSGSTNRIYILVDNIDKSNAGSDHLAKTVVHELQHMQCHNFPSEFYTLHKNTINSFYYELFGIMCGHSLEVNVRSCEIFGRHILYMFDDIFTSYGAVVTDNDYRVYFDRAAAVYMTNKMTVPKYGLQIAEALTRCAESMMDGKYFDNASKNANSVERYLYQAISGTYRKIGMNPIKLQSFFGQECIAPSEIIAMKPALKITPDLFAFLNRL